MVAVCSAKCLRESFLHCHSPRANNLGNSPAPVTGFAHHASLLTFLDFQLATRRSELRVGTMKFYPVTLLALVASVLSARAQLDVQVVLDQDKFLPAEQLAAGIRIV